MCGGKDMDIDFRVNHRITTYQFVALLEDSTLGERRPVEDRTCMEGMISNSNLVVTAWDGSSLVGIARSVTDFHYSCYLADLAVHRNHQGTGIGQRLQSVTREQLGPAASCCSSRPRPRIRTMNEWAIRVTTAAGSWIRGRA